MVEFYPGELKTARVVMRNPTQKGFDYRAALIVGLPELTRYEASFAIPALSEKTVGFTITMPSVVGIYPVSIQVTSGGEEIALLPAADINVIGVAQFVMPLQINVEVTGDGQILDMYWDCRFSVPVTNQGQAPGTHTLAIVGLVDGQPHRQWNQVIPLNPGETYLWSASQWIDFRRVSVYKFMVTGDWAGSNYAEGTARR
ncbi:MAG: hypothetical protein PHQ43_07095 [Dehalococcoidales bacterium]|nr:hypothetical protein [Dehalococcoidales bacterium]